MPSVRLTKEQLLKPKRRYVDVEIEELGGMVRIGSFSGLTATRYTELAERKSKGEHVDQEMMILVVSSALLNEDNKPLFTEEEARDFLAAASTEVVAQISEEIAKLRPKERSSGNSEASQSAS